MVFFAHSKPEQHHPNDTHWINLTPSMFQGMLKDPPRLADHLSFLFPDQEKLSKENISP